MKKRSIIVSFFNSHNIGDRMIARQLLERYEQFFYMTPCSFEGTIEIHDESAYNYGAIDYAKRIYGSIVLSISKRFKKSKEVKSCLTDDVKKVIKQADVLIIGGGNMLMYDYYQHFAQYIRYAEQLSIPIIVTDIGMGPFLSEEQHRRSCELLDKCYCASFRDKRSLALAERYCKSVPLRLAIDPCFSIRPTEKTVFKKSGGKYIAFNIMDLKLDGKSKEVQIKIENIYCALGKEIVRYCDKEIVLYSTVYEDYSSVGRLYRKMRMNGVPCKIMRTYRTEDLFALYRDTCFVVAMRMHSLILASVFGISQCGIVWQEKVKSYFSILQSKEWFDLNDAEIVKGISTRIKTSAIQGFPRQEIPSSINELTKVDVDIIESFLEEVAKK